MFWPVIRYQFIATDKVFGQVMLHLPAGRLYLDLDKHHVEIDPYDHNDEHQAHPEHNTLRRKKRSPEKDDKRDEVKNNPRL